MMTCSLLLLVPFLLLAGMATEISGHILQEGSRPSHEGSRPGHCKTERPMSRQVQCSKDANCFQPKKCCATKGGGALCEMPATNCRQLICNRCEIDPRSGFAVCVSAVDGNWGEWSNYGPCSASCGGGKRVKTRVCDNPTPANGGDDCEGESTETQTCGTDLCPVPGNWGSWGCYSTCSVTCGEGTQERTRVCDNPTPANGGADCEGDSTETTACTTHPCPVPGNWGPWGTYSTCSATCGEGTQQRTRECNDPAPAYGGADCEGNSTETTACFTPPCPVPGNWGPWGPYETCSATCGGGTQQRTRECNDPAPDNDGADCEGNSTETQTCGIGSCFIRLVGGIDERSGRVEIFLNGTWGTVCDDYFNENNAGAQVVCRMLGFLTSNPAFVRPPEGEGPIHLDNVECTGAESTLLDCAQNPIGSNDCRHYEDAGVWCPNLACPI